MDKRVFLMFLLLFSVSTWLIPTVMTYEPGDPVLIFADFPWRSSFSFALYPKLKYFQCRVYLSCSEGAEDISKVYMRLTDNEAATIFELRADNLNSTPTYSIQTGEDIVRLNESACNWIEDGDYAWAHFYVMIEWDCPSYEFCGIWLYAEDSDGNFDGWEEDRLPGYCDIASVLNTANFTSTGSARENVGELITVEGYLRYPCCLSYHGANVSGEFSPPPSELNILHLHDSNHVSVANTTVIDSEGYFNMSFNLPALAQENTYHLYIDMIENYTDGDAIDGDTIAIIGIAETQSGWTPSGPSTVEPPPEQDTEPEPGAYTPTPDYMSFGVALVACATGFGLLFKPINDRKGDVVKSFKNLRNNPNMGKPQVNSKNKPVIDNFSKSRGGGSKPKVAGKNKRHVDEFRKRRRR